MKCPNCNREIPNEANFCLHCGTKIVKDSTIECPSCHHVIPSDSKFCPDCGTKLEVVEVLNVTPCCPNCGSNEVKDDGTDYMQYSCNECGHVWGQYQGLVKCPDCGSDDIFNDGTDVLPYYCNSCGCYFEEADDDSEELQSCPDCGSEDVSDDGSNYLQYKCNNCGHIWGDCNEDGEEDKDIMDKLFPVCGITLGKTSDIDIKYMKYLFADVEYCKKGTVIAWSKNKDGSKGAQIRQEPKDVCFSNIYTTHYDEMFENWKSLGFKWSLSYDQWISLLEKLGFNIEIDEYPSTKYWDGRYSLSALVRAISNDGYLIFELNFNYGNYHNEGYSTDSSNSLYSIKLMTADSTYGM